ncbi:MAG: MFS transporter [Haliea sp.]
MKPTKNHSHSSWTWGFILVCVAAGIALSISMGVRQSLGLFLSPMTNNISVTVGSFGMAMAVQNLSWGITQPVIGLLADRFGSQIVLFCVGPIYALGLLLMAYGEAAGLLFGGGVLIGLAVSGSAFGVVLGAVSRAAPEESRALVVSIVSAAGSIGTLLLAPLGQHLIDAYGWQIALVAFAMIAGAISLMGLGLSGESNLTQDEKPEPFTAIRLALAHKGYVAMTIAFFACGFQLIFISTHLPGYIEICGLPPTVGATALALIGIFNAIGTLVIGIMGARYGNGLMLGLVYLLRTSAIAIYILTPVSIETTLIFASVMGLLWLSVAPLVSALITSMFGVANFGTLFGVMFLSHQVGSFFGAWLGGLSFDLTGNYLAAWWGLIAVGLLAFLLQISADEEPTPKGV